VQGVSIGIGKKKISSPYEHLDPFNYRLSNKQTVYRQVLSFHGES
jgi:hypothetical protein